jgi:hypothetical protein
MKRSRIWLIVAVIAVACLGAWWWHRGGSPAATPTETGARSGSAVVTTGHHGGAQQQGADPFGDLPVLANDDPAGKLRLEGIVLGQGDNPVPNATVVLDAAPPRTATTDSAGGFVFDGLVGRGYTLIARAGELGVAGPARIQLTPTTALVTLRLRPGATLEATVVAADAKPIAGATVELRGADVQLAQTGPDGAAKFAAVVPGGYTVVAFAAGMAKVSRQVRVAKTEHVRLVLAGGAPVSGRGGDDAAAPVSGAKVLAVALGLPLDARRDAATSGADGSFTFDLLAAGSLRFVANDAVHASGTSELVVLDGATAKHDVLIVMAAGAIVRGRVVDTAKQPVEGARVEIAGAPPRERGRGGRGGPGGFGGPRRGETRQAITDAKGEFTLQGLPRGPLVATAQSDKGAASPKTLDATKGDVGDVELVIDRTEAIAGIVVDDTGQPIEGAQVRADPKDFARGDPGAWLGRGDRSARTDTAGAFRIGGLESGAYTLRASRNQPVFGGRRGRGTADGVEAQTGTDSVRIVLPAEGSVTGKVAMADGSAPPVYAIIVGSVQQSFPIATFMLDALPPGDYTLTVRGPSFETHEQNVTINPGQAVDVGTISLTPGRGISGVVMSGGQPVNGATVYGGKQILGNGTTNDSPAGDAAGAFGAGVKTDTTGSDGTFALSGFGDGDVTVVAELAAGGRSPAVRVQEGDPNANNLVLVLQPFGALSGTLHQDTSVAAGVNVSAQSTTSPGAVNIVRSGADGVYRFDQLAPDTYKVSATLGQMRRGLRLYSEQVVVPSGSEAHQDLGIASGDITLEVTPTASNGELGVAIAWLASGTLVAHTDSDLILALAAAGAGTSQMQIARAGTATFTDLTAGAYTVCVVPLPSGLHGGAVQQYMSAHGSKLPAYCQPATVTSAAQQTMSVPVMIPAMIGATGSGG